MRHFYPPIADIDRIDGLIQSVSDPKDLTECPYTLRLISELIPEIEKTRVQCKSVYGLTLYAEITRRWLERDCTKHYIKSDDKLSLAAHLAAFFWRKDKSSASVSEIEDQLFVWIESEPRLSKRYEGYCKDRLKEDLRNSTFLSRFDKSEKESVFCFALTSLLEYFLARYLYDAVLEDSHTRWEMPCPSDETFDFLSQLLAESENTQLLDTMQSWGLSDNLEVNVNLLRYALHAKRGSYPYPKLYGIRLPGVKLRSINISLDMPDAVFDGADLRDSCFSNCNLRGASFKGTDVTRARILNCSLEHADMSGATLIGVIFRNTLFEGARMEDLRLYRTQWLWCKGLPDVITNSIQCYVTDRLQNNEIFPTKRTLRSYVNHVGHVTSVAYSPDGTRLATAGYDCVIRLWDATSGESIAILKGYEYSANDVSWSPNGTHIALAGSGYDGKIWILDAVSGEIIAVLKGHDGNVCAVSWSPDGTCLASAGIDHTIRIWDAVSRECIAVLEGHDNWVRDLSWSPDSTRLATAGGDSTIRIWNPESGKYVTIEINAEEYAVWNEDNTLRYASPGAWQWLGWQTVVDGKIDRLPAELFGPLHMG